MHAKLSIFYFFYFALLGVMAPYMGLYLEDKGFDLLEIAQLASLLMVTKVVAPNIWGMFADRFHNRLLLVRGGAFFTLLCFVFFFFAEGFWQHAIVIVCFSFFWNAVLPQFEVITLFNLGENKNRYSRIRLWGSVGFVFTVVGGGWLFDWINIEVFPLVILVVVVGIWLASLFHFTEPSTDSESTNYKGFVRQLLRPEVVVFFLVCFLLQLSHGAYYTYFSIYLESVNYDKTSIGLLWSLGVVAEILLFIYMHKWLEQHSLKLIIIVSLVFTALRWVLIAEFVHSVYILIFAQLFHALSFGAMHAASIHFVHHYFASKYQGRAQAFYSSVGFGAGGAVGAVVSGLVVKHYDYSVAFILSAVVALAASFLIATQDFKKKQS